MTFVVCVLLALCGRLTRSCARACMTRMSLCTSNSLSELLGLAVFCTAALHTATALRTLLTSRPNSVGRVMRRAASDTTASNAARCAFLDVAAAEAAAAAVPRPVPGVGAGAAAVAVLLSRRARRVGGWGVSFTGVLLSPAGAAPVLDSAFRNAAVSDTLASAACGSPVSTACRGSRRRRAHT